MDFKAMYPKTINLATEYEKWNDFYKKLLKITNNVEKIREFEADDLSQGTKIKECTL